MSRPSKPKPATAAAAPTPAIPAAAQASAASDPVNTPQVAPDPTGAASAPATVSAATVAEAATASVDPIPGAEPTGPNGYGIKVQGPAKGRWRIGRHFGPEPVTIPLNELTEKQLAALQSDPELNCVGVDLVD